MAYSQDNWRLQNNTHKANITYQLELCGNLRAS